MKFDFPSYRKDSPNRIVMIDDGVAEGCMGIGTAIMFLAVIFWPGVTDPGLTRNVALLFFSPFIVGGGIWGMVRSRYRKRFEFRIDARELQVEERSFGRRPTHRVVSFDAMRIEMRYDAIRPRAGPRWGYFTFVDYGDKSLAMHFSTSVAEAEHATKEFARTTGIAMRLGGTQT